MNKASCGGGGQLGVERWVVGMMLFCTPGNP